MSSGDQAYMREYRKRNKERLSRQASIRREEWRLELLILIGDGKCKDCGNDDHRVLEFDHLEDKDCNVSHYLGKNRKKAEAEARKCEVVCGNCHNIRTYERRQRTGEIPDSVWIIWSKTMCPKGHPKTSENLYEYDGKTFCRMCRTENMRELRAKT